MAGSVSFPITVEVAFGCDPMDPTPTWTDVSTSVLRSRTISTSRGSGESGEVEPGRGQIILANDGGDFTPGETGAYGLVRNRLPIRIRRDTVTVWTGLLEKLSMGFDNGIRPIVTGTLVDRWSRLKARTLTGERIPQVCQTLAVEHLWPLTDPIGATRAASLTSGWSLAPGVLAPAWSSVPNPQGTQQPAVLALPSSQTVLSPLWDGGGGEPSAGIYAAGFTLSAWVRCPAVGDYAIVGAGESAEGAWLTARQSQVEILMTESLGTLYASAALTTSTGWRHIAVTATITTVATLRAYVDGVLVATQAGVAPVWEPLRWQTLTGLGAEAGYMSTWDRPLTASEVAVLAAAGLDALGQTGDTADVRAALAAALWSPTTVTTQGTFSATMSKQAVDGVSQADLLQQCATTEGGTLHVGADGWPVLSSRGYRTGAALAATIPATVLSADAQWELDDTTIVNVATVERMALGESATTVTRRNDTSVAAYTEVSKSVQAWYDTDVQAVDRANTESIMWAEASPRSRSFAVDLATCQAAVSEATILGVDIGSRIVISDLPSQSPTQTAAGWYVDAVADEITATSWKRTFTVTPAIDFLVIDDATFGGLDEWPLG